MNAQAGSLRLAALALLLALAVAVSYTPALRGGFVWDDESYVTDNPTLRSPGGLKEIWTSPRSSPQYYPLVFTSFWAERRLWGLRPFGYHLTNVALHIANALLVWWLLRSLALPGAWLAAAIWGLHPVNVESVAWITERKNVLSGFFYLATLLLFVRPRTTTRAVASDAGGALLPGSRARLLLAYGCFLCALLSKTVTATLPLALALLWWWKGIEISARRVRILLPLFAAGAALGGMTIWMERFHVGAVGEDWALTLPQRFLVAGRALWFYIGKLLWPADLSFVYARWETQGAPWAHFLYPAAAAGVVAALWRLRSRFGRGPLSAALFFIVTLAPALGFVNVYPMRYSFVADHFAYLAGIGPVVLFAAVLDRRLAGAISRVSCAATGHRAWTPRALQGAATVAILVPLAVLSWQQAGIYRDPEALWRDTIGKNPAAWLARNNLGVILTAREQHEEAIAHYIEVLKLRPDLAETHANLGNSLLAEGRTDEALEQYAQALRIESRLPRAHLGMGVALVRKQRPEQAREHLEEALRLKPDLHEARYHLALISAGYGDLRRAEDEFTDLLQRDPVNERARLRLADVLAARGRGVEAERLYREVLRLKPGSPEAHNGLGVLLAGRGDLEEAAAAFTHALAANPGFAEARYNFGLLLDQQGRTAEAANHYRRAIAINPRSAEARSNLGVDLILLGDRVGGLQQIREALRLNPDDFRARQNLQKFEGKAAP